MISFKLKLKYLISTFNLNNIYSCKKNKITHPQTAVSISTWCSLQQSGNTKWDIKGLKTENLQIAKYWGLHNCVHLMWCVWLWKIVYGWKLEEKCKQDLKKMQICCKINLIILGKKLLTKEAVYGNVNTSLITMCSKQPVWPLNPFLCNIM